MLTRKQVAKKLCMSLTTLDKRRDAGTLPPHHKWPTKGRYAWEEADIDLFIQCYNDIDKFNKT